MSKILIAEDNNATGISVKVALEKENHTVELVKDGAEALERMQQNSYELIILDIVLPGMNGYQICRTYRSENGQSPVLMLTGLHSMENKEEGFGSGADDYLTKPFDVRELSLRVTALLRRPNTYKDDVLLIRGLELNSRLKLVRLHTNLLDLRPKEYALLEFLMKRPDQYFTLEDLRDRLWTSEADVLPDAIRKTLSRLRQKLHVGNNIFIVNKKNLGYRFLSEQQEA